MKKFIFITALTPKRILNSTREELFKLYLIALKNQSYTNWEVLLIGEENKRDGNLIFLESKDETKTGKLNVAYNYLLELNPSPDYIIRLDDDDLISPYILEQVSKLEFDCYADKYHTFIEMTSLKICQSLRPWLANTIIHKFEHAMTINLSEKRALFMLDHSKFWHEYYNGKQIIFATKKNPVYYRIISPTTITSGQSGEKNIDWKKYNAYLNTFGLWKNMRNGNLDYFIDNLKILQKRIPKFKMHQTHFINKIIRDLYD